MTWVFLSALALIVFDALTRPRDSSSVPRTVDLTALLRKRKRW